MCITIIQLSYRDVLHTREHIGHIDRMRDLAHTLGYPYFLWNSCVYKVVGPHYEDTGLTYENLC